MEQKQLNVSRRLFIRKSKLADKIKDKRQGEVQSIMNSEQNRSVTITYEEKKAENKSRNTT